jgi:hypothetical protein
VSLCVFAHSPLDLQGLGGNGETRKTLSPSFLKVEPQQGPWAEDFSTLPPVFGLEAPRCRNLLKVRKRSHCPVKETGSPARSQTAALHAENPDMSQGK